MPSFKSYAVVFGGGMYVYMNRNLTYWVKALSGSLLAVIFNNYVYIL